jgi:hypothetical protein
MEDWLQVAVMHQSGSIKQQTLVAQHLSKKHKLDFKDIKAL